MYTTIRHELRHARKAWPGTLVDQCLLSDSNPSPLVYLPNVQGEPHFFQTSKLTVPSGLSLILHPVDWGKEMWARQGGYKLIIPQKSANGNSSLRLQRLVCAKM